MEELASYFIYILYSSTHDRYYIGQTSDLDKRLIRHNKGYVRSTKAYTPWELVYHEEHTSRSESMRRERYLKSLKSRLKIEELVDTSR